MTDKKCFTTRAAAFLKRRATINLARLTRLRNRHTTYIAVTGSSAKSTTCALLEQILSAAAPTAARIMQNTMPQIAPFMRDTDARYRYAVIETGIDGPDRMRHLARLIRPHVAVVTMIKREHYKAMRGNNVVAQEKGYLVENVCKDGISILNADDEFYLALRDRARGPVVTFARDAEATYRARNISARFPACLSLTIDGPNGAIELQTQLAGEHLWLPVTAAVAVALELGIDAAIIKKKVSSFEPLTARLAIERAENDRTFLIDTFKAPEHSLGLAFDVIKQAEAGYKRIVIGQISDSAGSSKQTYRKAYKLAAASADEVIMVGNAAHRHGAPQDHVQLGKVREFADVRDAAQYLQVSARSGELILLKSNSKLHLERTFLLQTDPRRCWIKDCGLKIHCASCEKFVVPGES
jgi:UDP-N-acetylmuramoyl-tripeptide--D-alanyl-D-alanine ligase